MKLKNTELTGQLGDSRDTDVNRNVGYMVWEIARIVGFAKSCMKVSRTFTDLKFKIKTLTKGPIAFPARQLQLILIIIIIAK